MGRVSWVRVNGQREDREERGGKKRMVGTHILLRPNTHGLSLRLFKVLLVELAAAPDDLGFEGFLLGVGFWKGSGVLCV